MKALTLFALLGTSSAVRLAYEGLAYPWGNPYSLTKQQATNKELQDAWEIIEYRKIQEQKVEEEDQ